MNTHNDLSQDDHDDVIDQRLREAYEQIQYRDEWAERVLGRIASESDLQKSRSNRNENQKLNVPSRLPRRRTFALAASIVLAAASAYWLLSTPHRSAPDNSRGSDLAKQITATAEEGPELQVATYSSTESLQQTDTVTATTGYLAAKLTDEPEFEIYLVLPKHSFNKF